MRTVACLYETRSLYSYTTSQAFLLTPTRAADAFEIIYSSTGSHTAGTH